MKTKGANERARANVDLHSRLPRKSMNRGTKVIIAVITGLTLVAVGVAVSSELHSLWTLFQSPHWPQVPPPELYVTTQPKQEDVVGIYQVKQQTITTNGLAVFGDRMCQLDLRPDGSFSVTNYPQWPYATAFISTTGHWRCATIGGVYIRGRSQNFWGIVFSDSDTRIDPLALRSKGAPYDLMLTYGDGDDGTVMTFGRKK